jgi:release factor glutamine methyltransferase
VQGWVEDASAFLDERDVPEARANAEFIMAHVLESGRAAVALHAARELPEKQGYDFWLHVKARGTRRPLAYVLGDQDFMGLKIRVSPDVLVPRPETEELVVAAERLLADSGRTEFQILELGTGTGCVAIALAQRLPGATVYATDISPAALTLAMQNAQKHGVSQRIRFVHEDLFKPTAHGAGWADLVVSNPPYIPSAEIARLEPEVRQEPILALDGGKDGLSAIRAIAAYAPRQLKKGGFLALEIGSDQGESVRGLLAEHGFESAAVRKDMQGHDRIATGKW